MFSKWSSLFFESNWSGLDGAIGAAGRRPVRGICGAGVAAGALASAMGAAAAASGVTVLKKNGDASSVVAFDASDACVAFAIEAFASASSRALLEDRRRVRLLRLAGQRRQRRDPIVEQLARRGAVGATPVEQVGEERYRPCDGRRVH